MNVIVCVCVRETAARFGLVSLLANMLTNASFDVKESFTLAKRL